MSLPISPRSNPSSGRRHYVQDTVARREEQELLRYQAQLESTSRGITPQLGYTATPTSAAGGVSTSPKKRSAIPNNIIAHYTETAEERAEKKQQVQMLSSHEAAASRALQSKLLEDRIRHEQLAQIAIQKQIKEEELSREKALDAVMLSNASVALHREKADALDRKQKARDVGEYQVQLAASQRQQKAVHAIDEKTLDRQEAELTALQYQQETLLTKDYRRQAALADQRLWDHQKAFQAIKNSPTKSLTPREKLKRNAESDQILINEREEHQRLLDQRAAEEQRQQEEKVFKQLALIHASAEGTVKMTTPRDKSRQLQLETFGASAGMVDKLDALDKARMSHSDSMKKTAATHQLNTVQTSTPRKVVQNGLYSWASVSNQQTSSPRADSTAKAFANAPTMIERLASEADADAKRRKQEGLHIEGIQRMQADQRRLQEENERGLEAQARMRQEAELKAKEDALTRHLEGILSLSGVKAGSPKAARLKPIESPRRAPGPGNYGNYESASSPLRR